MFFQGDTLPLQDTFDGLVIMGGGMNVYEDKVYPWLQEEKEFIKKTLKKKKPMLYLSWLTATCRCIGRAGIQK